MLNTTPYFEIEPAAVARAVAQFRDAFEGLELRYAMKANSHPSVLHAALDSGCGFEAASWPELDQLVTLGVSPDLIVFGTAVKPRDAVVKAYAAGVRVFAADSIEEIRMLASCAPEARIFLRAEVDDSAAVFQMTGSGKFGAPVAVLESLAMTILEAGMTLEGLSFHVGSQSLQEDSWALGIRSLAPVLESLWSAGIQAPVLNIGGGFPAQYRGVEVPQLSAIAKHVHEAVATLSQPMRLLAEPGRALVASSMRLVASVESRIDRPAASWLYLNAGVYNALFEAMVFQGTTQYPVVADHADAAPLSIFTVAGPTGDGIDVITRDAELPTSLGPGDRLTFEVTGAYTLALAATFNGFPVPPVHVVADGLPAEPVTDTIHSRQRIGFPSVRSDWNESPAVYTASTLRIAGHPVMEDWEASYMSALARVATSAGGRILEVGYGMGLSCSAVQSHAPAQHVIIECHPEVAMRCLQEQKHALASGSMHLMTGFWEDVAPTLATASFDGILFDTYPLEEGQIHRNHWPFFPEAFRLLKPGGVLTYYSDEALGLSDEHRDALAAAGFKREDMAFETCDVIPPADCEYWRAPTIVAPIIRR